jgi:hypothetical protein
LRRTCATLKCIIHDGVGNSKVEEVVRMSSAAWAEDSMGEATEELRSAVLWAIPRAHEDAVAAQAASGTPKRDPYGHTMKNRQHECLVEAGSAVTGVEVFHPQGASFDLLRVTSTGAVLFPWRYATSARVARVDAKMRTSGFRRGLLATVEPTAQLTLEHAALSDDELEAHLADQEAVVQELRRYATVVTIGYASNPSGLLDLGWGVVELLDEKGSVDWPHWEPLPWRSSGSAAADSHTLTAAARLRSAATRETNDQVAHRFDKSAPLVDDFGLTPRNPLAGEPSSEAAPKVEETGTEQDQP